MGISSILKSEMHRISEICTMTWPVSRDSLHELANRGYNDDQSGETGTRNSNIMEVDEEPEEPVNIFVDENTEVSKIAEMFSLTRINELEEIIKLHQLLDKVDKMAVKIHGSFRQRITTYSLKMCNHFEELTEFDVFVNNKFVGKRQKLLQWFNLGSITEKVVTKDGEFVRPLPTNFVFRPDMPNRLLNVSSNRYVDGICMKDEYLIYDIVNFCRTFAVFIREQFPSAYCQRLCYQASLIRWTVHSPPVWKFDDFLIFKNVCIDEKCLFNYVCDNSYEMANCWWKDHDLKIACLNCIDCFWWVKMIISWYQHKDPKEMKIPITHQKERESFAITPYYVRKNLKIQDEILNEQEFINKLGILNMDEKQATIDWFGFLHEISFGNNDYHFSSTFLEDNTPFPTEFIDETDRVSITSYSVGSDIEELSESRSRSSTLESVRGLVNPTDMISVPFQWAGDKKLYVNCSANENLLSVVKRVKGLEKVVHFWSDWLECPMFRPFHHWFSNVHEIYCTSPQRLYNIPVESLSDTILGDHQKKDITIVCFNLFMHVFKIVVECGHTRRELEQIIEKCLSNVRPSSIWIGSEVDLTDDVCLKYLGCVDPRYPNNVSEVYINGVKFVELTISHVSTFCYKDLKTLLASEHGLSHIDRAYQKGVFLEDDSRIFSEVDLHIYYHKIYYYNYRFGKIYNLEHEEQIKLRVMYENRNIIYCDHVDDEIYTLSIYTNNSSVRKIEWVEKYDLLGRDLYTIVRGLLLCDNVSITSGGVLVPDNPLPALLVRKSIRINVND